MKRVLFVLLSLALAAPALAQSSNVVIFGRTPGGLTKVVAVDANGNVVTSGNLATAAKGATAAGSPTSTAASSARQPLDVISYDSSGNPVTDSTTHEVLVNVAARTAARNQEWCVTNGAGGSTLTSLAGRKGVALQNLGPNPIYCTADGQSPVATTLGWRIGPASEAPGNTWSADLGPSNTVKCIAATALQATGACTQVIEVQ